MATQTAIILKQDGTVTEIQYAEKDSLATLQKAVGGYIESVPLFGMDAYANEEGLYTTGLTENAHVLRVTKFTVMGNIVIPRITPTKRKRLIDRGYPVNAE